MKKTMMLIVISLAVLGFTATSFGAEAFVDMNSDDAGSLTIAGANSRPSVTNLSVSMNSYVAYRSTDQYTCQVSSASGKANDEEVLQFMALGNQTPGEIDDSNIYQKALGATPTANITIQAPTSGNSWFIRGTGEPSTVESIPN